MQITELEYESDYFPRTEGNLCEPSAAIRARVELASKVLHFKKLRLKDYNY